MSTAVILKPDQLSDARWAQILKDLEFERDLVFQFHRLIRDIYHDTAHQLFKRRAEKVEVVLRLVRKYTFIEAELDEGLQEYRPPFGPKTEVQCYVNDYTPQSIMPRAEPPLKRRRLD